MKKSLSINNITKTTETIKNVLKQLDKASVKLVIVTDEENKLLGTISDGDIRRLLLNGKKLQDQVGDDYFKNPTYMYSNSFSIEKAQEICKSKQIQGLPVVDNNHKVVDYFSFQKSFLDELIIPVNTVPPTLPVVVMSGGKGTRMKPMSDVFPKPLIPIKGKPMIEHIINYFYKFGLNQFYLTINYKSDFIRAYFSGGKYDYSIDFIEEEKFLGTAGSLSLMKEKLKGDFIISNCDCLVNTNFQEAVQQHQESKSSLTVITAIQHHQIPYGILNYEEGGMITGIEEKPELSLTINTGVYIANDSVFPYIKSGELFHMTDLIEELINNKEKVSCFFINEKEFVDFGQWKEYQKSADLIQ
tara:strand:- start:294 stop:1367 length:1074 start_codon:yes stop_codon:yes gene_type:complete